MKRNENEIYCQIRFYLQGIFLGVAGAYNIQERRGIKFTEVVSLMFMSSSLVKEPRVPQQKTELKTKTKNNAHQHTEAAVCGAIFVVIAGFIL